MNPSIADASEKNVTIRMRRWLASIKHEISLKKALRWYFKAMIVTYYAFSNKFPGGTGKSMIISALDRFDIAPTIAEEVNKTYNEIYRAFNSCVTVIDHPKHQYNKLLGQIDYFDEKSQAFAIKFSPSIPGLPGGDLIEPGFLLSMNTKNYYEGKEIGSRQRRKIEIKRCCEFEKDKMYEFDFVKAQFECFRQFYDETRDIQDENVYEVFLKQTENYRLADTAHRSKVDPAEWAPFSDITNLLDNNRSLGGTAGSTQLFCLPLQNAGCNTLTDISKGLGILDKTCIRDFRDDKFNQYIKHFNCLIVGNESCSSLLPRQRVNDEVVNLFSAW